jgi:hypothetical protein
MTLAYKWTKELTGTGKLVMKWAKEDLSEKRERENGLDSPW